ncbi:tRNA 2-thiouridine(34) synthase MnmA [Fuchsiella alkaliacetigena]|uniref:tRNA 2-thiouridine(34) synthase MnmA n=1 Tax=Fuchsiella alkaliacetigena TaxID=957042 RepID=UPI00200A4517|nr:tRNA 2-thiouridine(34) synthase MnmA [Fuchsiella alkaliacetigena]MCK8825244.1 tRNA 2-thiouridine(34) synthase MnmA [Fuchsiella alkaliacetigena]
MTKPKRVVVAMSGGVDSSLTAALLKERGYEVIGITMQIWPTDETVAGEQSCCSLSAVEDARAVAYQLDIPFYVVNFEDIFAEKVIDYFVEEYAQARTPNPCIMCNQEVKFKAFLKKSLELDGDYMATGHYAKIEHNSEERHLIRKAEDEDKDQSYTLYGLTQQQLERTLMPLGEFKKSETRELAKEFGLAVHDKPDSQEICFIPDDDYNRFLAENYPEIIEPGPILDLEGNKLGKHKGLPFYTIGQRRGLGLSYHKPLYVVELDSERNALIVGDNQDVFGKKLIATEVNWVAIPRLEKEMEVEAKVRYNVSPAKANIYPLSTGRVKVEFETKQRAITPGQAVVFYQQDILIGGGIIEQELR